MKDSEIKALIENKEECNLLLSNFVGDEKAFPVFSKAFTAIHEKSGICFNFWSAVFGMIYFVYYKLYISAFVIFLMSIILPHMMFSYKMLFWFSLLFSAVMGFLFFRLYFQKFFWVVKQAGYGILPLETVLETVKKKGGNDKSALVIFAITLLISIIKASLQNQI